MQVLMPPTWYYSGFASLALQRVHWENDEIVVTLLDPAHTMDVTAHEFWSDVSSDAVGPLATPLVNKLVEVSESGVRLKADNISTTPTSDNFAYIVIYNNTPSSDSDKPLLAIIDLGQTFEPDNEVVDIQWSEGVVLSAV